MSILDHLYTKTFEKLLSRLFAMATEAETTIVVLMKDRNGMVNLLANDEHADVLGDLISEAMIRLVQEARDEEEARNATKN